MAFIARSILTLFGIYLFFSIFSSLWKFLPSTISIFFSSLLGCLAMMSLQFVRKPDVLPFEGAGSDATS